MTEAISQQLAALNSKRHFKAALMLYARRDRKSPEEADAHMHYQAALAGLMLGEVITFIKADLRACPNYTPEMNGDLKRDMALSLIRRNVEFDMAKRFIDEAISLHQGSPERLAIDNQALGRLMEAKGDDSGAFWVLRHSLDRLEKTREPIDPIWISNTAFHTVRTAIKNGFRAHARRALKSVVANDPSWRKRWAARAMYYLPAKLGVILTPRLR